MIPSLKLYNFDEKEIIKVKYTTCDLCDYWNLGITMGWVCDGWPLSQPCLVSYIYSHPYHKEKKKKKKIKWDGTR